MFPTSIFQNNDEASHSTFDYINAKGYCPIKLTCRPYNFHIPEYTEWWLFPRRGNWPAYCHSKLFFHKYQSFTQNSMFLYVGFYVEKGLGLNVAKFAGVKKNLIMEPNWYWFDFIQHCQKNLFDDAINSTIKLYKNSLTVVINAYAFNAVPEPDKDRPMIDDSIELSIVKSNSKLNIIKPAEKILKPLNLHNQNFSSLTGQLDLMENDLQFFWIDITIGILLQYGNSKDGKWGAAEIRKNALKPWALWIG